MINTIALITGYAESAATGWIIFCSDTEFHTKYEAFQSFAEFMYQKYLIDDDKSDMMRHCCTNTAEKIKDANYCFKCGTNLVANEFNSDNFISLMRELSKSDCNSFGASFDTEEFPNCDMWTNQFEFDVPKEQILVISEAADYLTLLMLQRKKRELFNDDNGYMERIWGQSLDSVLLD